jgi:hypothetical protein
MKVIKCVGIFFSIFLLNACGQELSATRVATDYVNSVSAYVKPGAKVGLENGQVNLEVAGVQYKVDIHIISGYTGDLMTLEVSPSEGLSIVSGSLNPTITLSKGVINFPYTVVASEMGRYYIYMNAKIEQGEKMIGRSLTFIVQVGEEVNVEGNAKKIGGNGAPSPGVFSMPAKEDVIR